MRIETILEKGSARLNEDTLVAQGNLFGVFDGATSLNKTVFENGKTGGFIASSVASSIFAANHFPLKTLAKTAKKKDFTPLVTLYRDLGLAGLKHHIRQIEETDPECRRFPRFKTHDDIAAIALHDLSPAGYPKEH